MHLGIIADDFTGATDVAGFLVDAGVPTSLLVGVPKNDVPLQSRAVVISLRTRSCPPERAIEESVAALEWLRGRGARQIYLKYCSTFDSTPRGNIGPVTDALLDALAEPFTVLCPALPVNGRTVYNGYLFVNGVLLEESGMRHHPITPMTDSHVPRLMEAQARGRAGVVSADVVDRGPAAVSERLEALRLDGVRYAVLDATSSNHLQTLAAAVEDLTLVTGGSGLAGAMVRAWPNRISPQKAAEAGRPLPGDAVVLSGSCSEATRSQVAAYAAEAPARSLDVERCMAVGDKSIGDKSAEDGSAGNLYAGELAEWARKHMEAGRVPLIYATTDPETLGEIQSTYGEAAGRAVEATFAQIAARLAGEGVHRFIVAGGETAGAVVEALGIGGFHVGPQIAPGVPWVRSIDGRFSMALKSGNFGAERFFFECLRGR